MNCAFKFSNKKQKNNSRISNEVKGNFHHMSSLNKKQRPRSSSSRREEEKISIPLSVAILNKIIAYIFSENPNVSKATLRNIKKLFERISENSYNDNEELNDRVFLIRYLMSQYFDCAIYNVVDLFHSIEDNLSDSDKYILLITEFNEYYDGEDGVFRLSNEIVDYINRWSADKLNHPDMILTLDKLSTLLTDIKSNKFPMLRDAHDVYRDILRKALNDVNRHEQAFSDEKDDFSLDRDSLDNSFTDLVREASRPDMFIKTGVQLLNKQLGGGYKSAAVYVHMSKPAGWKSGYLLSAAKWAKEFNPSMPTRDPTKRPLILYVSQENHKFITMKRFYELVVPKDERISFKDGNVKKILQALEKYHFTLEDSTDISVPTIRFLYRKNGSIDTSDLKAIIEQYASEGYEVKIVFHDYLKRIRPVNYVHGDDRKNYGEVVNEFTEIAKEFMIPIVTAHQLNRAAIREINEAVKKGEKDVAKLLGGQHAGDSNLILENADCVTINLNIINEQNNQKMSFFTSSVIKMREDADPMYAYIAQPFESYMDMRMVMDEGMSRCQGHLALNGEEAREKAENVGRRARTAKPDAVVGLDLLKTRPEIAEEPLVLVDGSGKVTSGIFDEIMDEEELDEDFDDEDVDVSIPVIQIPKPTVKKPPSVDVLNHNSIVDDLLD